MHPRSLQSMSVHNTMCRCITVHLHDVLPFLDRLKHSQGCCSDCQNLGSHCVVAAAACMYLEYVLGSCELFSDYTTAAPYQSACVEMGTCSEHRADIKTDMVSSSMRKVSSSTYCSVYKVPRRHHLPRRKNRSGWQIGEPQVLYSVAPVCTM